MIEVFCGPFSHAQRGWQLFLILSRGDIFSMNVGTCVKKRKYCYDTNGVSSAVHFFSYRIESFQSDQKQLPRVGSTEVSSLCCLTCHAFRILRDTKHGSRAGY